MRVGYIEHYYIQSEDSYVLKNNKFFVFHYTKITIAFC